MFSSVGSSILILAISKLRFALRHIAYREAFIKAFVYDRFLLMFAPHVGKLGIQFTKKAVE